MCVCVLCVCGFACVTVCVQQECLCLCICFSVHVGVRVSECMMLRPRADACGLFAFDMDASQNTDISSETSSQIYVSHGRQRHETKRQVTR